ncbi:MAG: hypothetical protein P8R54_31890 [Myxococcota bacterium]|nr:hypothetical protein [Myxococcota bacterium]
MTPQDLAVKQFLPFCRTILLGGAPSRSTGQLPLRKPSALTAEVVVAMEDMINKAVMGWLIRGIGWRRMSLPDEDETFAARIWDEPVWGDLTLRFTAESIDTLLLAWNRLAESAPPEPVHPNNRRWRKMSAIERRGWKEAAQESAVVRSAREVDAQLAALSLSAPGDLLLHHLVFRSLHRRQSVKAELWMNNPLNAMAFYPLGESRTPEQCQSIAALLTGPLAPLMPWISAEWPALWRALPGAKNLDAFRRHHDSQAAVFTAWITACTQQASEHLLLPLVRAYSDQRGLLPARRSQLTRLTSHLPLNKRQPIQRQWAAALAPIQAIYRCHQDARRSHPIEREGTEQILLSGAAPFDLPVLHRDLTAAVDQLNDSIG